ncbi:Hsp20/alpha crystallin family protein [Candidatus Bathyarchaeota archaeon]|nr:Hsp20/alpha crystallin family protein [Candidatus Bathyarchaeota archaeon]
MSWINDDFEKFVERIFKQFGVDPAINTGQGDPNVKTWSYGYSMTMGPDGKPVIREFGTGLPQTGFNLGEPQTGFSLDEPQTMETLSQVDVDKENRRVRVLVEMPGVSKESIKVKATGAGVHISAGSETKDYETEVPLNVEVDPDSGKATYNNGVLDLTFTLVKAPEDDGVDVKVE